MPIIDGKVVRSRYTKLDMNELSSVDNPAQPGALATIMKRDGGKPAIKGGPSLLALAVAKYVDSEDGAHTFDEVLQANLFEEKIWPMTSALSQAIRSIMGDTSIKQADREAKVTQSVDEFLAAVRDLSPTAEKTLAEQISKGKITMNWEQIAKDAQAEVVSLKAQLQGSTSELATVKADLAKANEAKTAAEGERDTAKAALVTATEEVVKVGEREIKKSIVGEDMFAVVKAQQEETLTARLEKRAAEEFPNVVGTATEKALVLKARESLPEPAQKALDAILTSAQAMAKGAFGRFGHGGGEGGGDTEKAVATYKGKVAEIAKRDNIPEHRAMAKARSEFPAEFAAAYPDRAEAA